MTMTDLARAATGATRDASIEGKTLTAARDGVMLDGARDHPVARPQ